MAIPAHGFVISWGGSTLSEVQAIELDLARGLPVGRTTTWTPNLGTVRLQSFLRNTLPISEYGRRKVLKIEAPTGTAATPKETLFESDCIFEDTRVECLANDAVRFAFTFKVQDTLNAATNP